MKADHPAGEQVAKFMQNDGYGRREKVGRDGVVGLRMSSNSRPVGFGDQQCGENDSQQDTEQNARQVLPFRGQDGGVEDGS